MKKIFALFLILFCLTPTAFAKKKDASALPENSGYVGTLPDITERFQKSVDKVSEPSFEYEDGFNDPDKIKPAPRNNPAFINIIMKQDKTSQYLNDLNDLIQIIENLQTSIEEQQNIQKFNAKSYYFKENTEYFRDKYKNKAESSYLSFKEVMQLNTHVQSVAKLRSESEIYTPYVTAEQSGNVFSQNSINTQLEYLLEDIKKSLVILKETR